MHGMKIAALAATAVLSACTVVGSKYPTEARGSGVHYMLPKATLTVRLVDDGGAIRVEVLDPVVSGDPEKSFLLSYSPTPTSTDDIAVTVDSKSGLLQSIKITTKDETGEIIKKIAATVLRPEGALAGGATVIFQTDIDPGKPNEVQATTNNMRIALAAYLASKTVECKSPNDSACEGYRANSKMLAYDSGKGPTLTVDRVAEASANGSAPAPDCSKGVCYRTLVPFRITASFAGGSISKVVPLPNTGPIFSIPLSRFALVSTQYDVTFTDGMLQSVKAIKPSEGLALASLPLDIVKAVFGAVSELIQLKIDTSKKEEAWATQRVKEIEARTALEALLAKQKSVNPESALVGGDKGILLSAGQTRSVMPSVVGSDPGGFGPGPVPASGTPGSKGL